MSQRFPLVSLVLVVLSVHALAQDVFVTRGENGPVFSDKPQSGAKELKMRPLTVVPAPDTVSTIDARKPVDWPAGTPERASREAAPAYRSLRVMMPTDGGGVAESPALQRGPAGTVRAAPGERDPAADAGPGRYRVAGRAGMNRRVTIAACRTSFARC